MVNKHFKLILLILLAGLILTQLLIASALFDIVDMLFNINQFMANLAPQ